MKLIRNPAQEGINKKMIILTGHDTTILPCMIALGLPLDQLPGFCSHFEFEFYRNGLVQIFYNGKAVQIKNASSELIGIDEFERLTQWLC